MSRPRILLTRKLPPEVEARAIRSYDADRNMDDRLYAREEMLARAAAISCRL